MKCKKCGNVVRKGFEECPYCLTPVNKSKMPLIIVSLIVSLAVIVVVVLAVVILNENDSEDVGRDERVMQEDVYEAISDAAPGFVLEYDSDDEVMTECGDDEEDDEEEERVVIYIIIGAGALLLAVITAFVIININKKKKKTVEAVPEEPVCEIPETDDVVESNIEEDSEIEEEPLFDDILPIIPEPEEVKGVEPVDEFKTTTRLVIAPGVGSEETTGNYCGQCGALLGEEGDFCGECGARRTK